MTHQFSTFLARRCFLLVTLLLLSAASVSSGDGTSNRIDRVERGLLPAAIIRGQPAQAMSISERMAFHRVPGVSIAVINKW
jgi:hypothetical protein